MDKPAGFTSHDVVAKLRGILKIRKIGHGGTLDPLATGVLPVFIGGATKASAFAAAQEKEYIAGFTLGFSTDTQDSSGRVLQTSHRTVQRAALEQKLPAFTGHLKQVPPMYSAVKINGKKLYELARKGREIERPARDIAVRELELLSFEESTQKGVLRCVVSKGAYVRTLVHDLGEALGTLACLHDLRRTRSGAYQLQDCHSFEQVESAAATGTVPALLLPVDGLFPDCPPVTLTPEGAARAARGATVFSHMIQGMPDRENVICRVYAQGKFFMLGQIRALQTGGLGLFVYKNFR